MKRFVSILLIIVLVFAMSVAVCADKIVSPEHGNSDIDINDKTPSPQTGDTNTIFFVIAAAVLAIGVAVFCGKKLISEK